MRPPATSAHHDNHDSHGGHDEHDSRALVRLPALGAPVDELWQVLLHLAQTLTVPWTLVGGQMVLLHALEHDTAVPVVSQDGDIVADVRANPKSLRIVVAALAELGFDPAPASADGILHRWCRPTASRPVVVDLLAPDGLGPRADLTTIPPGRTVEAAAGTQLLTRTDRVPVEHPNGQRALVPRPNLLGAIVGKAQACTLPDPRRHYRDLALLCSLVPDPAVFSGQLGRKDRQRLRKASALLEPRHPAWLALTEPARLDGQIVLRALLDPP